MEFAEVVRRRRMVRRYSDRPVDPEVVDRLVALATRAPSAGFSQGWEFLVLDTADDVARYWAATAGERLERPDRWLRGMMTAPVVVVPFSHRDAYLERYAEPDKGWTDRDEARWSMPYWHLDTAMASLLVLLGAVDEGLGACFFGVPRDAWGRLREEFGVPAAYTPVGAITVGHRAEESAASGSPRRRPRRPLEDLLHRGGWGGAGGLTR